MPFKWLDGALSPRSASAKWMVEAPMAAQGFLQSEVGALLEISAHVHHA